ncbi:uncharacterized protein [Anas acuta]|uniref:uncharacterized protein isoform X2 n=1 Tax=Anas acuta TaxID=28680 RepID=UPI0035C8CE0B
MLGQVSWARLSPSGPAVLLLALCAVLTTQDICSSPGLKERGGNHQTPVLYLNASSAQEGETVLVQCTIDEQFPATRVFFCKNGQEEFSLKAQHGNINYSLVLTITSRSAGTYTCGYQKKNEKNWVKNSALSAPRTLSVPGSSAGETTQDIHSSPGMVLAVAAVGLVLLAAGSWFVIKKGACRGRCPRQQHIDSPQMEDTRNGEVQCVYYLLPWGKPHVPLTMVIPACAIPCAILPLHFPLGHAKSLPVHQGQVSSCPASSLHAERGCYLHKGHGSIPVLTGTKPLCLEGSFHTCSSPRLHFPCSSCCFCPFFSFPSEAFLLEEQH